MRVDLIFYRRRWLSHFAFMGMHGPQDGHPTCADLLNLIHKVHGFPIPQCPRSVHQDQKKNKGSPNYVARCSLDSESWAFSACQLQMGSLLPTEFATNPRLVTSTFPVEIRSFITWHWTRRRTKWPSTNLAIQKVQKCIWSFTANILPGANPLTQSRPHKGQTHTFVGAILTYTILYFQWIVVDCTSHPCGYFALLAVLAQQRYTKILEILESKDQFGCGRAIHGGWKGWVMVGLFLRSFVGWFFWGLRFPTASSFPEHIGKNKTLLAPSS